MMQILSVLRATATLFLEMAPYLMLGLTVAGILSVVMRRDLIAAQIGRPGLGSVFKASLMGVPLPLCSCGVVPTAAYLRRAGASRSAVTSFLISTPQTGVDSIAATYGMLGPLFAVVRPIAALGTGIVGGSLSSILERHDDADHDAVETESDQETPSQTLRAKAIALARYAYIEAIDDIAPHFLVGLMIGGVIAVLLPDGFFIGRLYGSGIAAMLMMVLVGIPMYVCSTSSIPIAVALIAKGLSPGAAYVFLVAGPATNAATLTILTRVLGRKQTALYVATIVLGSLLFGYGMEQITAATGRMPATAMDRMNHLAAATWLDWTLAAILGVLVLASFLRRIRARLTRSGSSPATVDTAHPYTVMTVEGMTCHHCAANVENAVRAASGIDSVQVELGTKQVRIGGVLSADIRHAVTTAIRNAGYDPQSP